MKKPYELLRNWTLHPRKNGVVNTEETYGVIVFIDWSQVGYMAQKAIHSKGGKCAAGPIKIIARKQGGR